MSNPLSPAVQEAHEAAVRRGSPRYIDPLTGYDVFTEIGLLDRGYCCGNRCRHCPYDYVACST